MYDEDDVSEEPREVEVEIKGRKWSIIATDPYGLWHVKAANGKTPEELSGSYTQPQIAEIAIARYMGSFVPPNPQDPEVITPKKKVLKPKDPEYAKA